MKIYDVLILGGGASGLMCAANINKKFSVGIIESNEKVAKKLRISGGGKCNITNVSVEIDNFDGDKELLAYALKKFSKERLLNFLERNRVTLEIRKNRYYFCQKSAQEIIDVLKASLHSVDTFVNTQILSLKKEDELFILGTNKNDFYAKKVVVATGGKSYAQIGASDIGLAIAKSFDIQVKEFTPALVGLTVQKEQFWMRELSGVSCYVHIYVGDKILKEEMLFTHKGISGPAVLSASLYWQKGVLGINFLPNRDILKEIEGSKKLLSSLISLPKSVAKALLKALDIEDKEARKVTQEDRKKLVGIHNYTFAPAGNFGFSKAEVSRGGVLAEEIHKENMESKKVQGLYFIGEVVDVTGELGGYNFQWAFSSAYVCAKSLKLDIIN
ncbi:MAG: aminoacetone oxidase family FAD-binding enzyme [Campylobacterales bacterium]|nr:aminoacetone oxidase family FAD-binding enzyme [Campylobacterales bacterium]